MTCYQCGAQWYDTHVCPVRTTHTSAPTEFVEAWTRGRFSASGTNPDWAVLNEKIDRLTEMVERLLAARNDGEVAP